MNSVEGRAALERAENFYEAFHWGHRPEKVVKRKASPRPETLAQLGRLESVIYSTNKKGDGPSHYKHDFGEEGGKKPILAVDVDTDRLHIVGGDYEVAPEGIVD